MLVVTTLLFAAAQFARCYTTLTDTSFLDLTAYAQGLERMPFQGRMLMMLPLRWAAQSHFLLWLTDGREGAFRSPELFLITATAFFSVCLVGGLVTLLYLKTSRQRHLVWMPSALLLMICAVQYILHLQNAMFPYDMPALLLFNLGLYLIYIDQAWLLVLLFPFITLNRETSLFLILLLGLDQYARGGYRGLRRPNFLAQAISLSAIWFALHWYVGHRFAGNPVEQGGHMQKNILYLKFPQFWPQFACIGAFLVPLLFFYRQRILNRQIRTYLWVILPWIVCMFFYGELVETRIFGELSGLIALAAVLALEESVPFRDNSAAESVS